MPTPGTRPGTDIQEPADPLRMALTVGQNVVLLIDLVEFKKARDAVFQP